jgi:hypothetical protein
VDDSEHLRELRAAAREAWRDGSELLRLHAELASREMADRTSGVGVDAGAVMAGVVCLHVALLGLLAAAALGLYEAGMAPWLATLSIALLTAAIGGAAIVWAKRRFRRRLSPPSETLLALRETGGWVEALLGGAR